MKFLPDGGRDGREECEWARQREESHAAKQAEDGSVK